MPAWDEIRLVHKFGDADAAVQPADLTFAAAFSSTK